MTRLILDITEQLADELALAAAHEGISVEALAVQRLLNAPRPRTLGEAIKPYIVPADDPDRRPAEAFGDSSQAFAESLVTKKAQGHF